MGLRSVSLLFLLLAYAAADCPSGAIFESDFNKCYQFFASPRPFLAAEQTCNSIGGHLVSIGNVTENYYISGLSGATEKIRGTPPTPSNFWIGANLLMAPSWSWTTNSPMKYSNWADDSSSAFDCGTARSADAKWTTSACNVPLPFACEVSLNSPLPSYCAPQHSICPKDMVCSPGYTLYEGNCLCYRYFAYPRSFADSKATCEQQGGMLASIATPDVNEFLTALPGINCEGYTCPYIGLYCWSSVYPGCVWANDNLLGNYTNFFYKLSEDSSSSGSKQTVPPPYRATFALIVGSPYFNPDQLGTWEVQSGDASFICQKALTYKETALSKKDESTAEEED